MVNANEKAVYYEIIDKYADELASFGLNRDDIDEIYGNGNINELLKLIDAIDNSYLNIATF